MKNAKRKRAESVAVFLANLLLIAVVVVIVLLYISDYQKKLHEQNLNDIMNINRAAANISSEFFTSQEDKLSGILHYLDKNKLSLDDVLSFLDDINTGKATTFQLIGKDYSGYVIPKKSDGSFGTVNYTHNDYSGMKSIFDEASPENNSISFSSEFTDQVSGMRSFARYAYITAEDGGETKSYTLMAVSLTSYFADLINIGEGYSELSTVLINKDGDYILSNPEFKSENFFQYIYLYNGLSLDSMKELQADVTVNKIGSFTALNSRNEECVYVCGDIPGTDWFSISCVPLDSFHITNQDLRFTVLIVLIMAAIMILDFWWLTELNVRLKISAREAQTANEAKTDFLSRMSHDIRTPINVITGMTELAVREKDTAVIDDYLRNIHSSGKFLLGLVNDILDMNKVESGKMELHPKPYSFSDFRTYINAVIVPLCKEKNIEFSMTGDTDELIIVTDSLRLNQIFFNLLSNAAKFTPSGGHVLFDTVYTPISDNRIALDFTVKDDGIGMSKEFQKNMFFAFTQEEKAQTANIHGTGLGLAIVKSLVDLMGGSISVISEEGKGSEFVIHMEANTAKSAGITEDTSFEDSLLEGKRALICEDHPLNEKIMSKLLSYKGMKTEKADNGRIGLEMFSASEPYYYDVILMDIRMPEMDGFEATKRIRALAEERKDACVIPIIALTANAYDSDVKSCLDAGMNAHLAKPIDAPLLYSTLCRFLGQGKQI